MTTKQFMKNITDNYGEYKNKFLEFAVDDFINSIPDDRRYDVLLATIPIMHTEGYNLIDVSVLNGACESLGIDMSAWVDSGLDWIK